MVVKEIDGVQTLLAAYWDGGYVLSNVEDPADATYIGDTRFDDTDPLTGLSPPEGNAHQAEFSHDSKFILAADEDFDAYRFLGRSTPCRGRVRVPPSASRSDARHSTSSPRSAWTAAGRRHPLRRQRLQRRDDPAGDGGGQDRDRQRFGCAFRAKTDNAESRGYRGVIIFAPATRSSTTGVQLRDGHQPRGL